MFYPTDQLTLIKILCTVGWNLDYCVLSWTTRKKMSWYFKTENLLPTAQSLSFMTLMPKDRKLITFWRPKDCNNLHYPPTLYHLPIQPQETGDGVLRTKSTPQKRLNTSHRGKPTNTAQILAWLFCFVLFFCTDLGCQKYCHFCLLNQYFIAQGDGDHTTASNNLGTKEGHTSFIIFFSLRLCLVKDTILYLHK